MKKKYIIPLLLLVSIILLVIITVSFMVHPQETTLTDEQKVMKIAVVYIEENYGTDYVINGEVTNYSVTEGGIVYNFPTASFRIPSDYFESGQLVNIMVDPDTEEIVKVYTHPDKGFPPMVLIFQIGKQKSVKVNQQAQTLL